MNRREAIKKTSLLLGGALSASAIAGVLQGCQPTGALNWEPAFLSIEQAKLVTAVADRILPATETPGASDVFVAEFTDLMLKEAYSPNEKTRFTEGLAHLDEVSQKTYQHTFLKCSLTEQDGMLRQLEKEAISGQSSEKPFFSMIKELTLLGYFTSEKVMQEVLSYNPIPGKYEGCVEMAADAPFSVDNNIF